MTQVTINPTELQPGDLVISLGYPADTRITVDRPEGNPWWVIDNITGQPVRTELSEKDAISLCYGLNLDAGPGGRYNVRPGEPR